MTLDELKELYPDDELIVADGFDKAIIGIDERSMRVVYSVSKCIRKLIEEDGMSHEDATEFFYYNTASAWVGDRTPIWCSDGDNN